MTKGERKREPAGAAETTESLAKAYEKIGDPEATRTRRLAEDLARGDRVQAQEPLQFGTAKLTGLTGRGKAPDLFL